MSGSGRGARPLNILAVEPFFSASHKAFLEGFMANTRHKVHAVKLNYKGWKWRMHGDSVQLAQLAHAVDAPIDLLLVSSMTNLPAFLALTNPRFATTPKVMIMHENQLTQPLPDGEERDLTYCYVNYLSMLSADRLVFSSQFHLDDMLGALPDFLGNYPSDIEFDAVSRIREKSVILPPGLDLLRFDAQKDLRQANDRPVIVWNQRWQFDRNPGMFFRVMNRLFDIDLTFELILAGDSGHEKPEEFNKAVKRFGSFISHMGYVGDADRYSELLHRGDIVVSTATYEFFCVSIMEAIYCGCHPLVPNRLHYPELIPASLHRPLLHAPVLYDTEDDLFRHLRDLLTGATKPLPKATLQSINRHMDWSVMAPQYDDLLESWAQMRV
jgi:glycosyltransferase involved in cell wall biosynthesis